MTQLFDPARHAPLSSIAWNEAEARSVIAEIASETIAAFDPEKLWPSHPLDAPVPDGVGGVYMGAAGNIWALEHLKREGAVRFDYDFRPALPRVLDADKAWLGNGPFGVYASLLMGDFGATLLGMRLAPDTKTADALLARAAANDALPVQDMMWALPGTMLAALWLLNATGDGRFADLYRRQAAHLLASLNESGGVEMWVFDLYGQNSRFVGLVHGFAGNMLALMRGWALLTEYQKARVQAVSLATLTQTAQRDGALANWPSDLTQPDAGLLCQICHGAPGIVAAFAVAPFSTPELEALLTAGAETVWAAGPLAKGSNFCHGSGGNAHAMLRFYARNGEALWLERARAFAMTAIAQYRAAKAEYGSGRHSLWTGDPGLAVCLWDCIAGRPRFPSLDCL